MHLYKRRPPSNRSSYAIEFKTDRNGDMSIIGNKDAFIALSLLLDKAIEGQSTFSEKFRRRKRLNKDIIVTFDYQEER